MPKRLARQPCVRFFQSVESVAGGRRWSNAAANGRRANRLLFSLRATDRQVNRSGSQGRQDPRRWDRRWDHRGGRLREILTIEWILGRRFVIVMASSMASLTLPRRLDGSSSGGSHPII